MAKIPLETSADVRAVQRLNKELAKSDEHLEEITKSAKGADAAARRISENANPQDRYNRKLAETALLLKKGKITMEEATIEASRLGRQFDRAGSAGKAAFGSKMLASVSGLATGVLSVGSAVGFVRSELQSLAAQADQIAKTQINAAGSREKLLQNIAGLPDAARKKFIARGERLAAELSQPQAVIESALADAYSGSGGNVEATFQNVKAAARYNLNTPDGISATAGALSDVSKSTQDLNATRNLGFLNKIGAASRVVDPQKQFGTIPQALAGMVTAEATAEQSGALYAALSNAMSDQEGNITTNAAINFGAKLEEFADKQIKAGKLSKSIDTFQERLAAVQGNQELGKAFVAMMGGEAKAKGVLEQLVLDPNSAIAKQYLSVQAGFGDRAAQIAHGNRTLGIIADDRLGKTASGNRIVGSLADAFDLDSEGYLTEESKNRLDSALTRSGRAVSSDFDFLRGSATGNRLRRYAKTGSQVSVAEAQSVIGEEIALLNRWKETYAPDGAGPVQQTRDVNAALEKLERAADAFDRMRNAAETMMGGRQE